MRLNKELETTKRVGKCDFCGIFISVASNEHTIRLINHRRSDRYKLQWKKDGMREACEVVEVAVEGGWPMTSGCVVVRKVILQVLMIV